MVDLVEIIVPTAVCCVMPVLIVLIVARMKAKKAEYLMNTVQKAIENGADVDLDKIISTDKDKFMKRELIRSLRFGLAFLIIGILFLCVEVGDQHFAKHFKLFAGVPFLGLGIGYLCSFAYAHFMLRK